MVDLRRAAPGPGRGPQVSRSLTAILAHQSFVGNVENGVVILLHACKLPGYTDTISIDTAVKAAGRLLSSFLPSHQLIFIQTVYL